MKKQLAKGCTVATGFESFEDCEAYAAKHGGTVVMTYQPLGGRLTVLGEAWEPMTPEDTALPDDYVVLSSLEEAEDYAGIYEGEELPVMEQLMTVDFKQWSVIIFEGQIWEYLEKTFIRFSFDGTTYEIGVRL